MDIVNSQTLENVWGLVQVVLQTEIYVSLLYTRMSVLSIGR